MRRAALLLALVLSGLPVGCAGADGQRAVELLQQADQAMAEVKTYRLSGRIWMETPVGDFTLLMTGGANTKTGASFLTFRAPDIPQFPEMTLVTRGDRAWVRTGRTWLSIPAPDADATGIYSQDLAQYVKAVNVSEGHMVGGEPAVKVTGVLDTEGLLGGVLDQLGSVPGAAVPEIANAFGDTRVVVYISETTHLPLRSLMDMSIEAEGETASMHMDVALTHINKRVKIPGPGS